ncbi:hypothetical protein HPB50_006117 [Hyalomma asiaticum]|uniref:Uncharacterized protein n=1 Tax=Hyalomma asiaticum TaxID=266040 RepID=A0ACB7T5Y5_HYAAI|nr:hypothetical protein HPB50_006117 [Hyalomma asiaticum]
MALTKTVVLVFSATVFVCEWHCSDGYSAIVQVPVRNGKCLYKGTEIPLHEPLKLEHPCQEWTCDPATGELSTTGPSKEDDAAENAALTRHSVANILSADE